jgi:hypothetical protein
MPFAAEPKPSDVLLYLPQLAFNTIKSLIMSTERLPKGHALHVLRRRRSGCLRFHRLPLDQDSQDSDTN